MYLGTVFRSEAQHILIGLFGRNSVQVVSDKIALLLKNTEHALKCTVVPDSVAPRSRRYCLC